MADDHSATTADGGMDMPAHEATYAGFIALTELVIAHLLCIILALVLWGLEGQGFAAMIGFVLAIAATAFGGMTGMGWRAVAPVVMLMGLACIVL